MAKRPKLPRHLSVLTRLALFASTGPAFLRAASWWPSFRKARVAMNGSGFQQVAFQSGPDHGMDVFWDTGEVVYVVEGGQAYLNGVKEGQFLSAIDGHRISRSLFEEVMNGQTNYTLSFKQAWKVGPAAVASTSGKRLHYVSWQSPDLLEEATERELTNLESERARQAELSEGKEEPMLKMRGDQRCRAVAELMYVNVWATLRTAGVEPVTSLAAGGHAHLPPCKHEVLTRLHPTLCLEALQEHIDRSMQAIPDGLIQLSLLNVGQAYAMSVLFGYTLRRAQERFNLEQMMGSAARAETGRRALMEYIDKVLEPAQADGEFTCMTSTKEAQGALMMQVESVFGDLTELRAELLEVLRHDPSMDGRQMIQEGKIASLRFGSEDMRRLILEAVTFGFYLHQAEKRFSLSYELSQADDPRVDEFGFETDDRGCPLNPG